MHGDKLCGACLGGVEAAAHVSEDVFGLSNSIFQLGIGPYIDASWTLSSILLLKTPQDLYAHLQALRRAGREVPRPPHCCCTRACCCSLQHLQEAWENVVVVCDCRGMR